MVWLALGRPGCNVGVALLLDMSDCYPVESRSRALGRRKDALRFLEQGGLCMELRCEPGPQHLWSERNHWGFWV